MKLAPILDPAARRPSPKPARVDLRKIFLAGEAIWLVMLILALVLRLSSQTRLNTLTLFTCAFGLVLGPFMLLWEKRTRSHYMKLAEDDVIVEEDDAEGNSEDDGRKDSSEEESGRTSQEHAEITTAEKSTDEKNSVEAESARA